MSLLVGEKFMQNVTFLIVNCIVCHNFDYKYSFFQSIMNVLLFRGPVTLS